MSSNEDVKKRRSCLARLCSPTKSNRLGFMLLLTFGFFLVELIVIAMARKPTNTMLDAAIITALYPGAILIVWVFEELLKWS